MKLIQLLILNLCVAFSSTSNYLCPENEFRFNSRIQSTDSLPYAIIPQHAEQFTAGTVLSRLVDGLGFRYFWATEGLRSEDLTFIPSENGRSTYKTIEHIYGLSEVILRGVKNEPIVRPADRTTLNFDSLRAKTLGHLRQASRLYAQMSSDELANLKLIYVVKDKATEYDYWNMINGAIADAIYHTGQVVSFRRTSGNPINPKVNVFLGNLRD